MSNARRPSPAAGNARSKPSGARILGALVVAFLLATRPASAADPVRHEGKTLAEWVAQANGKSDDKALDAILALGRARFLVEGPPVAVPALEALLGRGPRTFWATKALGEYGPLAASALGALRARESATNLGPVVSRVLIGRDVEQGLKTWREEAEKALANADRVTRGMTLPKTFEFGDTPLYDSLSRVNMALTDGGRLGLRGEGVAAFAKAALKRPYGHLVDGSVLWAAEDLGAASAPLGDDLVPFFDDPEPVLRWRAARALAWIEGLSPATTKRMLKAAVKVTHAGTLRSIAQGLAVTPHEPAEDAAAALRILSTNSDKSVSAWAFAGLARRGSDVQKLLPTLLASLKHAEAEVRAAAADGLLAIGRPTEASLKEVAARLSDPDLRVRWRCGALIAKAGGDMEAALAGLLLGVDGPDDIERVEALKAVRALGPAAAPLRERVAAWSAVPLPRLAGPARLALDAIDGK